MHHESWTEEWKGVQGTQVGQIAELGTPNRQTKEKGRVFEESMR